jgi:hypothetical protein
MLDEQPGGETENDRSQALAAKLNSDELQKAIDDAVTIPASLQNVTDAPIDEKISHNTVGDIRKALGEMGVNERDPATLLLKAMAITLAAGQAIPQAIEDGLKAMRAETATQVEAAKSQVSSAIAGQTKDTAEVSEKITSAAQKAAGELTRTTIDAAGKALKRHQDNRYVAAFAAAGAVMTFGGAALFRLGEYAGEGLLPTPPSWLEIIWNCPAGYVVVTLALISGAAIGASSFLTRN